MIFMVSGIQVENQNRPKNEAKTDAGTEGLGNPIFFRFCSDLGASRPPKTEPRRAKIIPEPARQQLGSPRAAQTAVLWPRKEKSEKPENPKTRKPQIVPKTQKPENPENGFRVFEFLSFRGDSSLISR